MSTQASLVFVHIHKTAGCSITAALMSLFDHRNVYNHLHTASIADSLRPGFVASHDRFPALAKLSGDKIFVTCLRNPAGRLLSLYNFWRSIRQDAAVTLGCPYLLEARQYTFEEFICSSSEKLSVFLDNEMTRVFSDAEPGQKVTEKDLEKACQNLAQVDSILIYETLEHDFKKLLVQLGCEPRIVPLGKINITSENAKSVPSHHEDVKPASLSDLSAEALDRLSERTHFDRRLYDFAQKLRETKNRQPSFPLAGRLPLTRAKLCRGDIIRPTNTEAFASLLGEGWATDRSPQWSVGRQALLHFAVRGGTGDNARVEVHFGALLLPNRPSIVIDVRVDGGQWRRVLFVNDTQIDLSESRFQKVTDVCAGLGKTWKLSASLDADADEDRVHTIEFRNQGVSSPALLGLNPDQRDLSIRLDQLMVV